MENEKFVFKKINFLNLLEFFVIGIFLLLVFVNPIFAQSPALKSSSDLSASDLSLSAANLKKQRLEWKADSNAIEYKIEVRTVGSAVNSASQGKVQTFTTENSFIEFSLPSGQYEWRVIGIDFLGREQIPSGSNGNWQKFEIRKLVQPEIKKVEKKIVVENSLSSASEQNTTKIPILSSGVESDASVCLENVENGKVVTGKIENEVAIFPKVDNGEWKVKITNKSGLESETEPITIVDRADEEKRLEKLEQERLAQIEAERLAAEIAASDSESASAEESTDETP